MTWCGDEDLDLHVRSPSGVKISWSNVLDSTTGGQEGKDSVPDGPGCWVENIVYPPGAEKGEYTFYVDHFVGIGGDDEWTVRVSIGDEEQSVHTGTGDSEVFSFILE